MMGTHLTSLLRKTVQAVMLCSGLALPVTADPVLLPEGVPLISESLDRGETIIDSSNVSKFRPLLLPELERLVVKGGVPLPAIWDLPYGSRLSEGWWRLGVDPYPGHEGFVPSDTLPYPNAIEPTDDGAARQLLWNTQSLWWKPSVLSADVDYQRYRVSNDPALLKVHLARLYTSPAVPLPAQQLFRELLQIDMPAALQGQRLLSVRFSSSRPDRLWEGSLPAGVRDLDSWVRTERFSGGLFIPDDLFVESASPESYSVASVRATKLLVPFPSIMPPALIEDGRVGCLTLENRDEPVAFNENTHRFVSAPGWVSSEMTFVPRNVLLVEARERSAYAKGSRIALVVDRDTELPLIKLVKSDSGSLLRLVLGSFILAKAPDGRMLPMPRQTISIGGDFKTVDALTYRNVRRCGDEEGRELKNQLDTKELIVPTPTSAPAIPTVMVSSEKGPNPKNSKKAKAVKKEIDPVEDVPDQQQETAKKTEELPATAGDGGPED